MKSTIKFYSLGILIAFGFFMIGLVTLSDYGINIDETIHFIRGHAYLNFLTTGKEKYLDSDFANPRSSEWKYRGFDAAYFIKNDAGHPALNDILAAATNIIFHEKLGIIGDLEAYHLFELFVSSLLVFLIFVMVRRRYGVFAGVVASLSIGLYPLFYGESHFNIKDPLEASFFAFTIFFFYLGLEKVKGRYFFISSLFCALALGTKFNIVFLPFIIFPYLLVRYFPFFTQRGKLEKLKKIPKTIYLSLFLYPFIVLGIHFLTRPYLWPDPLHRFLQIVQFYKDIGTGLIYQSGRYTSHGLNFYPLYFVSASTPIIILSFFVVGTIASLLTIRQDKDKFSFLLLLWFWVTILRVMWPGTSIYGGVRQIMEYIPAMAAISGIGAVYLRNLLLKVLKNHLLASIIILASFIPLVITICRLHPNENIFMNSLVGGLKGATEKKIPGVGETMGNAYLQGILWLNNHAEKNARFGFPVGLGSNLAAYSLRHDIKFGGVFSGIGRKGEYMMEMFSVEFPFSRYTYDYLDRFLIPVYVKTIDGVPILKIWKNDKKHTKQGYLDEIDEKNVHFEVDKDKNTISISLEKPVFITRLEIDHDDNDCIPEGSGKVSYSPDGKKELVAPDDLFKSQGPYAHSLQTKTHFVYLLAALPVKAVFVTPDDQDLCLLQVKKVQVSSLRDLKP